MREGMSPRTLFFGGSLQHRKEMPASTTSEFTEELAQNHQKMVEGSGSVYLRNCLQIQEEGSDLSRAVPQVPSMTLTNNDFCWMYRRTFSMD